MRSSASPPEPHVARPEPSSWLRGAGCRPRERAEARRGAPTGRHARGLLASGLLAGGLLGSPAALAQEAPGGADGPPPSVAEALDFVNSQLTEHASPWRPCRATAKLVLVEGGDLSVEIARSSYCEDSMLIASVHALDASRISYEVANEIVVRLPCKEDEACARYMQRRKKRDGEGWITRDTDWIPKPPAGKEHMVTALELPMSSRSEYAADVASALAYLVKAAGKDPTFAEPVDRFDREPPAATADGT